MSDSNLSTEIQNLEQKQAAEAKQLRDEFNQVYERMKPVNLIKSTFHDVTTSPAIKSNLLGATVGMAAGYLVKLLFTGFSKHPVRRLLGSAVMIGVTNIVANNPETIKSLVKGMFDFIRSKRAKHKLEREDN